LDTRVGKIICLGLARKSIKRDLQIISAMYIAMTLLVAFTPLCAVVKTPLLVVLPALCVLTFAVSLEKRRRDVVRDLARLPNPSRFLRDTIDRINGRAFIAATLGLSVAMLAYKLYKQWSSQMMAPITEFETSEKGLARDAWMMERKLNATVIPTSQESKTTPMLRLRDMFAKKLCFVHATWKDGKTRVNHAMPMKSNVWLVPAHSIPSDGAVCRIDVGHNRTVSTTLNTENTYVIPKTDYALWYVPEAGPQKDLTPYLPIDTVEREINASMVRMVEGESVISLPFRARAEKIDTTAGGIFDGFAYELSFDTYPGLCMAPIIGEAPYPFVAGFHLAGKGKRGACGRLTRTQFESALTELSARHTVLLSHSRVEFDTTVMGVDVGPLVKPKEDAPCFKVSEGANMLVLGSHTLPVGRYYSEVRESIISKKVEEKMGLPKMHGKPHEMNSPIHWEVDLENKSHTAYKFKDEFLAKAYVDYETKLSQYFDENPHKLREVGKITDDANLAGIDGVESINAINFRTSKGFPFGGPKTDVVSESARYVQGISMPRDLDPEYWKEVARMEDELLAGRTINTVFKGALKDEPTKIGKTKVRVFAGSNFAFTLLVRKYFLTLAKLVQANTEVFECAVGVDTDSPTWTELEKFVRKYGADRIIAGDYKSFDGQMSPKVMGMAFKLLIKVADWSGHYDDEDLVIMRGIATEICSPLYDFHGILIQVFGSNPSGHPLTVIINSLVNSLYLRYCYYSIHSKKWFKSKLPLFHKVVAALTYGDDNKMGVAKGYEWFNHTAIANELGECGIVYTMADKEAASVPFIHADDASFLKHYAVWDDELKLYRAPIEEASIQKMLHTHMSSKFLTKEEQAGEAITNAAAAYFQFGRETYTKRIAQLAEVASECHVPLKPEVLASYDERLFAYKQKFQLESQMGVQPDSSEKGLLAVEKCIAAVGMQPMDREVGVTCLFDIDLVYNYVDSQGKNHFIYIEVKSSKRNLGKARKQIRKVTTAMAILGPRSAHYGVTYCPSVGFELISLAGASLKRPVKKYPFLVYK
jgi:hypothetical protein